MGYLHLFERYGSPQREADLRLSCYLVRPDALTLDRIPWNDQQAARYIAEIEATAAALREYRQALAARYAELSTMPYALRLEIKRTPASLSFHGVYFDIRIVRRFEDGTETEELREHFTGKERRQALARFEDLKKQHPGIEIVKDIEKKQWEK